MGAYSLLACSGFAISVWENCPLCSMKKIKGLLCALSVVGIVVALCNYGYDTYLVMRGGGLITANVIEATEEWVETSEGREAAVTVATYEFQMGHSKHQGSTQVAYGELEKGDTIRVVYNPSDPSKNRAEGDRDPIGGLLVFAIVGGLACYFLVIASLDYLKAENS
jgi:hypothetical protein